MPTDDFTNNTSTAGSLNVNDSVAGKIESIDDTDWFKVPLIADTTYQIDLQGSDSDALQNPYLKRIYDANGLLILDNQDQESPLIFTPTTSGDYYIEAGATDDATGSYLLSIIDNPELVSPEVGTVDTQGPTLIDFSISSTVDVSSGSAPLELSVEALDDLSGIDSATIYFSNEFAHAYTGTANTASSSNDAIGLYGLYDSWSDNIATESKNIFNYNSSGIYSIERITLIDSVGNNTTYTTDDLIELGFNTQFELVGATTPDIQGPILENFSLTSIVDVSSGSAPLELSVEALDDLSGIDSATIYFSNEFAHAYTGTASTANSINDAIGLYGLYDSWNDNIATESKNVFDYNTSGIYSVERITLIDNVGNNSIYTTDDLIELGFDTQFELTGTVAPDIQGPSLINFSISSVVDVSSGSAPLELSVEALDALSGINNATIYFSNEFAHAYTGTAETASTSDDSIGLYGIYDSWNDNIATESKNVFDYNQLGIYHVEKIAIADDVNNYSTYTTSELSSLGYETSFWLTDSSLPESNDYSFSFIETEDGVEIELYGPSSITGDTNIELKIEYSSDDLEFGGINFSGSNDVSTSSSFINNSGTIEISGSALMTGGTDQPLLTLSFGGKGAGSLSIDSLLSEINDEYINIALPDAFDYLINNIATGSLSIQGSLIQNKVLTADTSTISDLDGLGEFSYQWLRDGETISNATDASYLLTEDDVFSSISVEMQYIDSNGSIESFSTTSSTTIANVNDAPTGSVTITGIALQGETLAIVSTLADADGRGSLNYQWLRDGTAITNANNSSYQLVQEDVDTAISIEVSYTDLKGTHESSASLATAKVENINDLPTGELIIEGLTRESETLTITSTLEDPDGISQLNYQWLRDGSTITGATEDHYTLTENDIDSQISIQIEYIDDFGQQESLNSASTDHIVSFNELPTGSIDIEGSATQGQILSIINTLQDANGLGEFSYQWLRDSEEITAATEAEYSLSQEDVNSQISITVSYTDNFGNFEAVTSSATTSVLNINDTPTGSVEIEGTTTQGEALTLINTLSDIDGLGEFSYQWLRNGGAIEGAIESNYQLIQDDVNAQISVSISYTDQQGTVETVTSEATSAVTNTNDAPTGSIDIEGDAVEGTTLSTINTLEDNDGLGEFNYQWLRDGATIEGAISASYQLTQVDVGSQISVSVNYADQGGTTETITSSATSTVENHNDLPTGVVDIAGNLQQGEILTITNTLQDTDGLGEFNYQWLRDGIAINGANDDSYQLTQDDVDAQISVMVSYTDQQGTSESLTSDTTSAISNTNDSPTGDIEIIGTTQQGNTLTIDHTLQDADGLGEFSYQWLRDGIAINGATDDGYLLTQEDVDTEISVTLSYNDGQGSLESLTSDQTASIENINDTPTGDVIIEGDAEAGSILSINNTLLDTDGLGDFSYQWLRDGIAINEASEASYQLTADDKASDISVKVSYTDQYSSEESIISESVTVASDSPYSWQFSEMAGGVELALYGPDTISGTNDFDIQINYNSPLTFDNARFQSISSTSSSSSKQNNLGSIDIAGQAIISGDDEQALFTLTFTGIGQDTLDLTFTDIEINGQEISVSGDTSFDYSINSTANGELIIEGDAVQGSTLTVDSSDISDANGLGEFSYQWFRDGEAITDATDESYLLTQEDVGSQISANTSFTDAAGFEEGLSTDSTDIVENLNDTPTGEVLIEGTATQGETLTITSTLEDLDGLGELSYQWLRDGEEILEATSDNYLLTEEDVDSTISVTVNYLDGFNNEESIISNSTEIIANLNDEPTGTVEILGTPAEGETLSINNTLEDLDGIETFSYQWLRDGEAITDATADSYQLTSEDIGSLISVIVSYTDGHGQEESFSAEATTSVENTNDRPTGDIEIEGITSVGKILTINNTLQDTDGLGEFSYQWLRNGEDIDRATDDDYRLTGQDMDTEISVRISYTDGFGTVETITSEETQTVVTNGERISGRVQDGYVAGAAIYIDKNGNNLADSDEATGLFTDENGRFSGTISGSGTIMAIGGINTDTGLANNMILAAPEGSGVISPITTLLESLIDNSDMSEEEAEEQLSETLGLSDDIDLYNFDPLDIEDGQSEVSAKIAVEVQKINVQLAVAATLADDTSTVMSGLAEQIVEHASSSTVDVIDLSNSEVLNVALSETEVHEDVITAIATANTEVKASETLAAIADTQQEATAPEIEQEAAPSSLTYADTIQKTYVAYYGRPADPGGLEYWNGRLEEANGNLYDIIGAYGNSEEFIARYGSLSNSELIDTIYQQMFGRAPDEGGKAFYLGKLNANEMTLQTITLDVLNGAQNEDLNIVNNKVSTASYFTDNLDSNGFTYAGNSAAETAKELLDAIGVDSTALTEQVESFFQSNNTLTGSWVVDTVEGIQESGVITFFDDNTFLYSLFNETEDTSELEQGSYTWDTTTGSFNFDLTVDNDTESGLSAEEATQITRTENQLAITTSENLALSKLDTQDNSIVGSWYSNDEAGNIQVISFMANGQFVVSESSQSETATESPVIETGVEAGSYAWLEATGAFIFDVTYDSNGREGFSHSGANEIQLVGNQLQLTSDEEVELFNAC